MEPSTPAASPTTLRRARRILEPLARYHGFTVEGLDNLPLTGPVLLAVHHTLATYDGFLIGGAIFEGTGRLPRGLGDDRIFQIPGLGALARGIGLVPASPEAGEMLLREGHVLGVAPGGMWESLRPRDERRRSRWDGRKGFARLALRTGAPLVMAACPAADDLYTVYPSRLTDRVYRRAHLPVPIVRGLGPSFVPRPVKLTAYLSRPVFPPAYDPADEDAQVDDLHAEATAVMAELLARGGPSR